VREGRVRFIFVEISHALPSLPTLSKKALRNLHLIFRIRSFKTIFRNLNNRKAKPPEGVGSYEKKQILGIKRSLSISYSFQQFTLRHIDDPVKSVFEFT
jgi:hypothetical protein